MSFLLTVPMQSAETGEPGIAISTTDAEPTPQITLNGQNLRVRGAAGENVEIYNVTGVRVTTKRLESNDQTIQLGLSRGCYIVKIGKFVRKINIL